MGYHVHHAIVVTSWQPEAVEQAHAAAMRHFDGVAPVTPIVASRSNGYTSFMIAPDGSKEGWESSDAGDSARSAWMEEVQQWYPRGIYVEWAELAFGGDEGYLNTRIMRHSEDDEALAFTDRRVTP